MDALEHEAEFKKSLTHIPTTPVEPNWRKDIKPILLLFFLYILQGIPLGLMVTVPFLLIAKNVPYTDQAKFSMAFWPFSLKILYAPIIDAIYWPRLGRRKSWLIPLQYLIAIFLLIVAYKIEDMLERKDVASLAAMFFVLNFFAASQDVAVDGWALTMLSPENVGHASTCNAVGQTLGFVLGYSVFLTLDSPKFANRFRQVPLDTGFVTFSQFATFWSIIFAVTTTLILIFKKEKKESDQVSEGHLNIFTSYRNLWKVLKLRNIRILALFLLTVRIGTAATDSISKLKLVGKGIPKETLAFFVIPLIPVKLLLPILAARWTAGPAPMKTFIATIPISLLFGIVWPLTIHWTDYTRTPSGEFPFWFILVLFGICALELVPGYLRFVSGMAFSAKISDPAIGGTFMTLLNTLTNIGGTWPGFVALWLVDYVGITIRDCPEEVGNSANVTMATGNDSTIESTTVLSKVFEKCVAVFDGYYVESAFCVVFGFLWLIWGRRVILNLQRKPISTWRVVN